MSKLTELFGVPTHAGADREWIGIVERQECPFLLRKCYKVRKSLPEVSIGSCSVRRRDEEDPIMICPARFLERRQIFMDCMHLLTQHEPGNELHVVQEVPIPGGSVDYFLCSASRRRVKDFVAIEIQTLDTTGTVWPERQRFLAATGVSVEPQDVASRMHFGLNWKMTAKTILVQMHHKVSTFEQLGKKLALVLQDSLLRYMQREFSFGHVDAVRIGDPLHFHSYRCRKLESAYVIDLQSRLSTDAAGVQKCLGLQAEARVELTAIVSALEARISEGTRLTIP